MTMSVLVSNYSGPYTAVATVFDGTPTVRDGETIATIPVREKHELPPGQCVAITLWKGCTLVIEEITS